MGSVSGRLSSIRQSTDRLAKCCTKCSGDHPESPALWERSCGFIQTKSAHKQSATFRDSQTVSDRLLVLITAARCLTTLRSGLCRPATTAPPHLQSWQTAGG